ncbi:MAG: hypothetical protein PVH62_04555 [Anaerolineae bacterium]|jgi:hypothetical protein
MNLRKRVLVLGGVFGALLGVSAAYLYLRSASVEVDESGEERLPPIQPADALKIGLGLLTAIRQIAGLGQRG